MDFGRLIEREIPRLRRYARALTRNAEAADDLVQDCLVRAIAKQHLWQVGTDLRAWLFTILHNQYVNAVRRSVRRGIEVELADTEPQFKFAPRQDEGLQVQDIKRLLEQLPEEQRTVILLAGLECMRYDEIAEVLHISVGTVRSRLSRGRDALRKLYEGFEIEKPRNGHTNGDVVPFASSFRKRPTGGTLFTTRGRR